MGSRFTNFIRPVLEILLGTVLLKLISALYTSVQGLNFRRPRFQDIGQTYFRLITGNKMNKGLTLFLSTHSDLIGASCCQFSDSDNNSVIYSKVKHFTTSFIGIEIKF